MYELIKARCVLMRRTVSTDCEYCTELWYNKGVLYKVLLRVTPKRRNKVLRITGRLATREQALGWQLK